MYLFSTGFLIFLASMVPMRLGAEETELEPEPVNSPTAPEQTAGVDENKIRHGKPLTSIQQFPFMASIWLNDHKLCTSSIIGPSHILSAGHCFLDEPVSNFTILVGTVEAKLAQNNGVQRKVVKSDIYSRTVFGKDIAIAQLNKPLPLSYGSNSTIQPIRLSRKTNLTDGEAFIAGWGRVTDWSVPVTLQGANVSIWPHNNEHCEGIIESEICAYGKDGANVCFGDSGGPLLIKNEEEGVWEQIGITSRGNSVCELNAFFTTVSLYCDWIAEKSNNEAKCAD